MNAATPNAITETRRLLWAGSAGVAVFSLVFALGDKFNWPSPRYFPAEHLWIFTDAAGPGRVAMGLYGLLLYAVIAGAAAFGIVRAFAANRLVADAKWDRFFTWLTLAFFTASSLYYCVHLAARELKPVLYP